MLSEALSQVASGTSQGSGTGSNASAINVTTLAMRVESMVPTGTGSFIRNTTISEHHHIALWIFRFCPPLLPAKQELGKRNRLHLGFPYPPP